MKIPPWQIPTGERERSRQPVQIPLHIPSPDDIPPEYRRGPHGPGGHSNYRQDDGEPFTIPMGGEDDDDGCTIRMC